LQAEYPVPLPVGNRPTPEEVADWLERTLRSEDISVRRVGEATLEFRSKFRLIWRYSRNSLACVGRGEVDVVAGADGPVLAVRANPRIWYGLIPIALLFVLVGWTDAAELLRWGAGLGGLLLGGILLFLNWSSLNMFLISTAANLRIWRTGRAYLPLPRDNGAGLPRV
jgi:hypothetical protein